MSTLDQLTVVEFSTGIAAAYCGKLLADAGATVVVVEPVGGHPLRRRRPAPEPAKAGLLFEFLMASKRVVDGDGAPAEAGLAITDGLASSGAGLRARWPGASSVHISAFGEDGPWAERPVTEITLQAAAGSLIRRGLPGRTPVQAGGAITEYVAGSYAAALAASYWWGERAGHHLDVSSFEAAGLSMHSFLTVDAELRPAGHVGLRRGPSIPSIEPSADGYVGFSTITGQQFRDFLLMIERPDLADDAELLRPERRQERRDELDEAICSWTTTRTTQEIVALATAFRIPVAPIGNGQNLPANDHMVQRGVYQSAPEGGLAPRVPYRISSGGPAAAPIPTRLATGSELPLAGLKVADFTAFWAGPSATHMLACLGADVIKIESIQRPDGMRFTSARPDVDRPWEWGAVFHGVNANKRSVTLHLRDPKGKALADRLVEWADVVIENFSPRVMDQFGFGWDAVHALHPRAVMVRMPAFGLDGPWRDRTGFAMTVEQASGLAWQTGYVDGPPMDVGGVCDPMGGMHAVVALMVALSKRDATGEGSLVELPLVEVALNAAAEHVLQWSREGVLLGRYGNRDEGVSPQGVYRCGESWVCLSVSNDIQWQALATVAGIDCSIDRLREQDRLDDALADWCTKRSAAEVEEQLIAAGVPAAALLFPAAVLDNPQLVARGFYELMDHPEVGRYRLPSLPVVVDGQRRHWQRTPPPMLGQHNDEVLGGLLGLSSQELEELRAERIIGDAP